MWNRAWNFTGCMEYDDLDSLKLNLINLFEKQGATYLGNTIASKALHDSLPKQWKHPADQSSSIWIVGLYPGNNGWTIAKTYPSELLCHSVIDGHEYYSQLSALTFQLKCNAFHLSLYGGICGFLLEADARGKNHISGSFFSEEIHLTYYKQAIQTPGQFKKFSLLNVSESLEKALAVNQSSELKKKLDEINMLIANNPELEYDWDVSIELDRDYTERIDIEMKNIMDNSDYWYINNLANAISNNPYNIDFKSMSLLYFTPPKDYKSCVID